MVVAYNPFGVIYYSAKGIKTLNLEPTSWGYTLYNNKTGEFVCGYHGLTEGTAGCMDFHIYSWNGNDDIETHTYLRNYGYDEYDDNEKVYTGKTYINGKEVTNEQYELEIHKNIYGVNASNEQEHLSSYGSLSFVYNVNYYEDEYIIYKEADTNITSYLDNNLYY